MRMVCELRARGFTPKSNKGLYMRIKADEFASGQYYHLYNRCVSQRQLFIDEADYLRFLALMKQYLLSAQVNVVAYCLMPNHYHFLLQQTTELPVYLFINKIAQRYARYYNAKYDLKGALWSNKLQHICIQTQHYLLRLCAYIHLNPLKANLVIRLDDWKWSNYLEWIDCRNGKLFHAYMRDSYFPQPGSYVSFIHDLVVDEQDSKHLLDE